MKRDPRLAPRREAVDAGRWQRWRESAAIRQERFDRPVGRHTVEQVPVPEPPPHPPRRPARSCGTTDPVAQRRTVVTVCLDRWSLKAIDGYPETPPGTDDAVPRRRDDEGWPGLVDGHRPKGWTHRIV